MFTCPGHSSHAGLRLAVLILAAAPRLAQAATVTVTHDDCRHLVRHVPEAGVEYRPGVDVYGRPVAPADLGGGIDLGLPETYSFNVDIQPFAYAERRRIEREREAVRRALAGNAADAEILAGEAAALADREADFQAAYEAAAAAIVAATGGPSQTNAAVLANRTAQLEALRTNRLGGPDYIDLQEDLARNRETMEQNQAQAAALRELDATLDADRAAIAARGLDASTMTVGRVTIDINTGRATFNGRPLQSEEEAALAAHCRQVLQGR